MKIINQNWFLTTCMQRYLRPIQNRRKVHHLRGRALQGSDFKDIDFIYLQKYIQYTHYKHSPQLPGKRESFKKPSLQ